MGQYRARDLVNVPCLISLTRVPLAALFPLVVGEPLAALGVLVASGMSDVLDGWYARRSGQVTPTGIALDPVTDKLFVITVVATLVVTGKLGLGDVVLLSTREIGELPLVFWYLLSPSARERKRSAEPAANWAGKLATALQFATVTAALFSAASTSSLVFATAGAGVVAAFTYWGRALRGGPPDVG